MPTMTDAPVAAEAPAGDDRLELTCFLHEGWKPLIRPASPRRGWMDSTPESFAYRCLPLNIANAHGWEVLSSCAFEAMWDGRPGTDAVTIRMPSDADPVTAPVSIFGQGVLTFHIAGLFRTPPGWNLWVGGSPNHLKDGIAPLGGVVETDWAPFTFTMNWRFTRPNHWVRFEAEEAICLLFPVKRDALERFTTRFAPIHEQPELVAQFEAWSRSRDAFHKQMQVNPPTKPADRWQKHYYRGVDAGERAHIDDHQTKLRVAPFEWNERMGMAPAASTSACPVSHHAAPSAPAAPDPQVAQLSAELARLRLILARRDWILDVMEGHRHLSPAVGGIQKRPPFSREEFLQRYYASGRPVVVSGDLASWPALTKWTPEYLKAAIGDAVIEYQGGRESSPDFERNKDAHRREAPFREFIDLIARPDAGNDAYMTAYNSARNAAALAPLAADMGQLDTYLNGEGEHPHGMFWIGPAGSFTPLHHDLTNNLLVQVVGRKNLRIAPPSETWKLYNDVHVFSAVGDIEQRERIAEHFPAAAAARFYDITLEAGDVLFLPIGWWHQVRAQDFSITLTCTNFHWPNDAAQVYPQG